MPCTIIVGTQFGDEGKGKIVDYFSQNVDFVVRYNGGANAGHTVVVGNDKFAFRLLPSGVLRKDKTVVLGNGMVIDPELLLQEIDTLKARGISPAQIFISDRAHVVMPYHKLLDGLEEKVKGDLRAGTTKRGIGPCYSDKIARFGIRVGDLIDELVLHDKLTTFVPIKERIIATYDAGITLSIEHLMKKYLEYGIKLAPYVRDTVPLLNDAINEKRHILLESAQGTHLDIDYGVYPFGTSSNAVSGGACTGTGIPPTKIDKVIGVVKAYTSRVGEGPFPTEIRHSIGDYIREKGGEYGTVTNRPRRCGWLDLIMVKYSLQVNGVTSIALTKLDVLSGLDTVKVCIAYTHHKQEYTQFPANTRILSECQPVYQVFSGWDHISKREWTEYVEKGYEDLPLKVREYITFIEDYTGVSVDLLSVGPERRLTIRRE